MQLADFIGKHTGATCWLFGKGPSLDRFPMESAGLLRIAINDACVVAPDCQYIFANDGIRKWKHHLKPSQFLFQPDRALKEFDSSLLPNVVIYKDGGEDRLHLPAQELAECLQIKRGTLCSALQVLAIMGVSTVVMIGIDGTGEHSAAATWSNRIRGDSAAEYLAIRDDAIATADALGIILQFFTHPNHPMENGKIKITITRNCFVEGQPLTEGQSLEVNPRVARELYSCGSAEPFAEPFAEPEKLAPETADSKHPARETAARRK